MSWSVVSTGPYMDMLYVRILSLIQVLYLLIGFAELSFRYVGTVRAHTSS